MPQKKNIKRNYTKRRKRKPQNKTTKIPFKEKKTFLILKDIFAFSLIFISFFLLLSLISYTPNDLPSWLWFDRKNPPNDPVINLCGIAGATTSGLLIWFFGAASYLLPACLLWLGFGIIIFKLNLKWNSLSGLALVLISSSSIIAIQNTYFTNWSYSYNIISSGGNIGKIFGETILLNIFDYILTYSLLAIIYFCGIALLVNYHPVALFILIIKNTFKTIINLPTILNHLFSTRKSYTLTNNDTDSNLKNARPFIISNLFNKIFGIQPPAGIVTNYSAIDSEKQDNYNVTKKQTNDLKKNVISKILHKTNNSNLPVKHKLIKPKIIDSSYNNIGTSPNLFKDYLKRLNVTKNSQTNKQLNLSNQNKFQDYSLPDIEILDKIDTSKRLPTDKNLLISIQKNIIDTLGTFGIDVTPGDITKGPTITRYEIYPSKGLRVKKIVAFEADIARATKATRINILAPIPGKDTVGIEIANDNRVYVHLRDIFSDKEFLLGKKKIPIALGKDVYGKVIIGDLANMPHLLVAGATGSGKSVCINSIIASLLYRFSPDELRLIMIDPKVVEMQIYNDLPHQIIPVVTDPKKVLVALKWVINEMEKRYQIFAKVGSRNFDTFNTRNKRKNLRKPNHGLKNNNSENEDNVIRFDNQEEDLIINNNKNENISYIKSNNNSYDTSNIHNRINNQNEIKNNQSNAYREISDLDTENNESTNFDKSKPAQSMLFNDNEIEIPDTMPYIVIIIDELADLMQTAPADVEIAIARITQKARAAGIHMIVATQTPRSEIVTGVIKANIPSRIAFQVSSAIDSRVILDCNGAERLVGQGDLLYLPPGASQLIRTQGALITDEEIQRLVKHCSTQSEPNYVTDFKDKMENNVESDSYISDEDNELLNKCIEIIKQEKKASTSMLQRRLRIGYTRAARMMDILEDKEIVAPGNGAKPREILMEI